MSAENKTENAVLPPGVAELQKEARILDLCDLAKRTTEKLAAAEVEIGETRKRLDNFIGARECFNKKAAHAAKVLAGCGAIGPSIRKEARLGRWYCRLVQYSVYR